jgi:translation initiation factor IF-1
MPGADAIKIEGVVVEALPNGTYRVELSNGHRLLAFVPGKARLKLGAFGPGDKVMLQMSPYDLSEGRIIAGKSEQLVSANPDAKLRVN